ncbi:hypothetical protein HK096_008002, partial [Nowakowskiella sp. JEL0078]
MGIMCLILSVLHLCMRLISRNYSIPALEITTSFFETFSVAAAGASFQFATDILGKRLNILPIIGSIVVAISNSISLIVRISKEEFDLPDEFEKKLSLPAVPSPSDSKEHWIFIRDKSKIYARISFLVSYLLTFLSWVIMVGGLSKISDENWKMVEEIFVTYKFNWIAFFAFASNFLSILFIFFHVTLRWDIFGYSAVILAVFGVAAMGFNINFTLSMKNGELALISSIFCTLGLTSLIFQLNFFNLKIFLSKQSFNSKTTKILKIISGVCALLGELAIATNFITFNPDQILIFSGGHSKIRNILHLTFNAIATFGTILEILIPLILNLGRLGKFVELGKLKQKQRKSETKVSVNVESLTDTKLGESELPQNKVKIFLEKNTKYITLCNFFFFFLQFGTAGAIAGINSCIIGVGTQYQVHAGINLLGAIFSIFGGLLYVLVSFHLMLVISSNRNVDENKNRNYLEPKIATIEDEGGKADDQFSD